MPKATYDTFGIESKEAIANLAAKIDMPSRWWDEYEGVVHGRAFMVAGATKVDLLKDLHSSLNDALKNGKTLSDFRKDFDVAVQKHGWSYKGKRGWRTKLIFNTNMRTARMAGRWQQIEQNKTFKPYIKYITVDDARLRPQHRTWSGIILPVDDSFWNSHYPPNGWGCRCTVITLSDRQLTKQGLSVSKSPKIKTTPRTRVDKATGEVLPDISVPEGIDTGWDYNVGKAWLGADKALGEKLMQLPAGLRSNVLEQNAKHFAKNNLDSWKFWLNAVQSAKIPKGHIHSVGLLKPSLVNHLSKKGKLPNSALITIEDNNTVHLSGKHKSSKKAIGSDILKNLPLHIYNYDLALWDKKKENLILIIGDEKGRAAVEINYKLSRGAKTNSVRSLGVVDVTSFNNKNYEVIEGEW